MERDHAERASRVLHGHTDTVHSTAFSGDGRLAVTGGGDGTVRVWELATDRCLRTLEGSHARGVIALSVDSDAKTIRSADFDGVALVWRRGADYVGGSQFHHPSRIWSVAFSPDARLAVTGDMRGSVVVWDGEQPRHVLSGFNGASGTVSAVAVSPGGDRAASGTEDGAVRLWDLASGECLRTLTGHSARLPAVIGLAFSPDGRLLVSGSYDETLRVWEVGSGRCLRTFTGHTGWVFAVAFSPDGQLAVSGGQDQTVRVWEVADGQCLHTFTGHTGPVRSVAVSPDGRRIISGSEDRTVRVWEFPGMEAPRAATTDDAAHVLPPAPPGSPVQLDVTGWQPHHTPDGSRGWMTDTGALVLLNDQEAPLDEPCWLDNMPALRRNHARDWANRGCLIESRAIELGGMRGLVEMAKVPDPRRQQGITVVTSVFLAKADHTVTIIHLQSEGPETGMREAAVALKLGMSMAQVPHPYDPGLATLLPWLRADQKTWDEEFPEHPVALSRAWIRGLAQRVAVDPAYAALPEFRGRRP